MTEVILKDTPIPTQQETITISQVDLDLQGAKWMLRGIPSNSGSAGLRIPCQLKYFTNIGIGAIFTLNGFNCKNWDNSGLC